MVPHAFADWVANSDAFNHTTLDAGNLSFGCPPHINDHSSIIVGELILSVLVTSVGDMTLPDLVYINNVLVTPEIIQNLLSVHHFTTDS
jgi:hypothetical protein